MDAGNHLIAASALTPPPSPTPSNGYGTSGSGGFDSPESTSVAIIPPPRSSSSPQIQNRSSIISVCTSWISGTAPNASPFGSMIQRRHQKTQSQTNQQQQSQPSPGGQSPTNPPPTSPIISRHAPSGYLWKQGSSLKLWKRRYFVLQDSNCIFYFQSREDAEKPETSPIGVIVLDNFRGIWRCDNHQMSIRGRFVFRVECSERKWLFASEDNDTVEDWITALRQILQTSRVSIVGGVSDRVEHAPALMKGWLEKHSRGSVRQRWFELKYNMLYCYRDDTKKDLLRMISLKSCLLEIPRQQFISQDDSDAEEGLLPEFVEFQNINERPATFSKHQQPQYGRFGLHLASEVVWLKCFDMDQYENWLGFLLELMELHSNCETPSERAISEILKTFPPHVGWNEAWMAELNSMVEARKALHYDPNCHSEPQTTIIGQRPRREALKLSKGCHLFAETGLDRRSNPNYLVQLVQSMIRRCLRDKQLQNEIIVQLIRLTTRHAEPDAFSHLRAWQLMAICLTMFLPARKVFGYLQLHLKKSRNDFRASLIRSYIGYCENVLLEISGKNTVRRHGPSKMEMDFLLSLHKNPKEMNIPVHSVNGCVISVTFAPHTRIEQIQEIMIGTLGLQPSQITNPSMFTICAYLVKPGDDSNSYTVHNIPLDPDFCVADLICKHEKQREEFQQAGMQFPSFLSLNIDYLFLEFRLRHLIPLSPLNSGSTADSSITNRSAESTAQTSGSDLSKPSPASLNPAERRDWWNALLELRKTFVLTNVNIFKGAVGETKSISLQRWRLLSQHASEVERDFMFRQMNDLIVRGKYPVSFEAAVRLAALQAQATWGDHFPLLRSEDQEHLEKCVKSFLPVEFRKTTAAQISAFLQTSPTQSLATTRSPQSGSISSAGTHPLATDHTAGLDGQRSIQSPAKLGLKHWLQRFAGLFSFCGSTVLKQKLATPQSNSIAMAGLASVKHKSQAVESCISRFWIQLRGFSTEQCIELYLENTFQWPWALWSSMFPAKVECPEMSARLKKQQKFLFAACTDAVGILNFETKQPICVFGYNQIISGGISDKHSIFLILEASDEDDLIFNGKRSGAVKMEIQIPTIKATDLMDWLNYFIDMKGNEI